MRILHFADLHAQDRTLDEIKKCCGKILETAAEEKPDLIVNAGDTFDDQMIRVDTEAVRYMMGFHRALSEIAPVAVVIGTPSHDGKAALVLEYSTNGHHNVIVSSMPEQLFFSSGELYRAKDMPRHGAPVQAVLSMIPTPTKQYFKTQSGITQSDQEIADAMSAIFAGVGVESGRYNCPHIMVGHFQVAGARISETQHLIGRDIEISKNQIELGVFNLGCLGHIHMQQEVLRDVFYSGSIYRKDFGEMENKGFYLHEIGSESRFIETPTRRLVKIEADFTAPDNPIENLGAFIFSYPRDVIRGAFVRCQIRLWQDEAAKLNKAEIEEALLSVGAEAVEFKCSYAPRENVRSTRILTLATLREKVRERAELSQDTVSESVLAKADFLEASTRDEVVGHVIAI